MESTNTMALTMDSNAFENMRDDFNSVLKKTIGNMLQKQSDLAEITVKVKVMLRKDNVPEYLSDDQSRRDVICPVFKHKVGSVMQIREEESGEFKGNYELVWDDDIDDFVLRPIEDGQVTFTTVQTYTDSDTSVRMIEEGQKALPEANYSFPEDEDDGEEHDDMDFDYDRIVEGVFEDE